MNEIENVPFFEKSQHIKEESWGGAENKVSSIAFDVPEGIDPKNIEYTHVLKEPRGVNYFDALGEKFPPKTDEEKRVLKNLSEYFNSTDHFINSASDYKAMGEIFKGLLPETHFIIGEPRQGNERGFYILQDRINGKTWSEFTKNRSSDQNQEFMMKHRNQLINLIGGARRVLVELGGTVDIWGDNIMVDNEEHFLLIDPGSPSEFERLFDSLLKLPKDMRTYIAKVLLIRLNDLEKYPSSINMSEDEINAMNESAGITGEQYEEARKKQLSKCEQLTK